MTTCHCDQCDEKENPVEETVERLEREKKELLLALEAVISFEKNPDISRWARIIKDATEVVEGMK